MTSWHDTFRERRQYYIDGGSGADQAAEWAKEDADEALDEDGE